MQTVNSAAALAVVTLAAVALVASGVAGTAVAADGTRLAYEGDRLTVAAGPDREIAGRTDRSPGTGLTVRVESTDPSSPYLSTQTDTVDLDGTFRVTANLAGVAPGTEILVTVLEEGEPLARAVGTVVECDGRCGDASGLTPENDEPGQTVTTERLRNATSLSVARLSEGPLGEAIRIPVALGNASAATLTVGGPAFNYEVAATLRDGNGDGRVDVLFRTAGAGRHSRTLVPVDVADSVTPVGEETTLRRALDPAGYAASVARGTNPDAPPADEGTVVVYDSEWRPTPTDVQSRRIREASDGLLASAPLDAVGTISIGAGLALLALRVLFVARR